MLYFPKKFQHRHVAQFLVPFCIYKNDNSEIRYTYIDVNKNLEKLSNKNLTLLLSSYCPLL